MKILFRRGGRAKVLDFSSLQAKLPSNYGSQSGGVM